MDPITLTAISMGAAAAGGATGAIGSLLSGKANSDMYKYQAGVAKINQDIQKQNADYARKVGEVEAQTSGMKTRAQLGQITAAQAHSGIDINSGSAVKVRESQSEIGAYDESIIRSNAAKRAYGFEVEATQAEAQGAIDRMAAKKSETAGAIGATTSLLGAASSVSSKWLQAKQVGIFE